MKRILLLLPLLAALGLAQPKPSYSATGVFPASQPNDFNNYSAGPQYQVAPLIIDCYCSGYTWIYVTDPVRGLPGWQKQYFNFTPYPSDRMANFVIGIEGVCSEVAGIFRHTDLASPIFDYGYSPPIPIPGVFTEVTIGWAYNGIPYQLHDKWSAYCDPDGDMIETNYIPGPYPC